MAGAGRQVVVVSSGDPGVFAMASAVFEAIEAGPADWRDLDIRVLPGITAMLAAAARAGAPLGHDFCAINLSDNLKPWALIEKRLRLAAEADFAMAFYNPRSRSRPEGFAKDAADPARSLRRRPPGRLCARRLDTPKEDDSRRAAAGLHARDGRHAHGVLVGASTTRIIERAGRAHRLHAKIGAGMTQPAHHPGDGMRLARRDGGPVDHQDRQAQRARRDDLGLRASAARILGHHRSMRCRASSARSPPA